ncbi:CD209 antigen-like protein E [Triplophysa rosa]|nr:CD209 antigen-like protein E [Triplophysa rosa]
MEEIYENTNFKRSSVNKSSYCKGNATVLQERDTTPSIPSKGTKVLLMVLCASLVLAVGSLCVLGVLFEYNLSQLDYNKCVDFGSLTMKHNMVSMQLSIQEINNTCMERECHELNAKFDRLKSYFNDGQSCNLSVDGWTVCRGLLYFSAEKHNWSKSRDVCVSKGADLVTITSQNEQDFLVSKIKETHWIGLNDLETEGRWVWVNNQTLEETGVEFWFGSGQKEPDNWKVQDPSGENCASLGDRNGNLHTWFDGSCKQQKKFICENKY